MASAYADDGGTADVGAAVRVPLHTREDESDVSKTISEVFLWVILASAFVLIVMNAAGFAQATTAVGTQVNDLSRTLSGSGYVNRRAA